MKYFLIAGEASGDLHGANLVREITKVDPAAEIQCWGGDLMEANGARLLKHYRDLSIMGILEVIKNLGKLRKSFFQCRSDIEAFKPDVVIMIDFPGFNLRLAKDIQGQVNNIYYFISPKIWAWKKSRIKKIRAYINRMYVIFPFEPEFYRGLGYNVKYFGNPLVESVKNKMSSLQDESEFRKDTGVGAKPLIALLAGSRVQEVKKMLPEMVKVAEYYLDYTFVVAGVKSIPEDLYNSITGDSGVKVVYDKTHELYAYSTAAIVTSGTATLEAAIAGIPQVVTYKTSGLTYRFAKAILKIRFISLVNLIMDREVVKELIQHAVNPQDIVGELNIILPGGWKRQIMLNDYEKLMGLLDGEGAASRVATDMYNSLSLINNVN